MKKAPLLSLVLMLAVGVLGACDNGGKASDGDITVGVLLLNGDTYFTNVGNGVKEANQGQTIIENYSGDAGKEAQAIDNLIARGVDAIVTSPLDAKASSKAIERAAESGVKVVCYNTCIEETRREGIVSAFVLSDQAGMGEKTGKFAAEYLSTHAEGTIRFGVLHCDTFDICRERREAFFKTLDDAKVDYEIVAKDEELVVDKAVPAAENMLTSHPEISALWGANDGATAGLVRAVDSAKGKGKIMVFGSDMTPVLGKEMLATPPTLLTTTGQDGLATGEKSVEVVQMIMDGQKVSPFVQKVPVVNYSVDDPEAVQAYLDGN